MRLRIFTAAAGILLSTLILGCKNSQSSDPHTIIVAIGTQPSTLDPRIATDAYGMRITSLLFSSLVRRDSDLKVIGEAAESWTYKDLVYEFRLKPNLTFSDGQSLTAEDLLFSFEQFMSSSSPHNSSFKMIDTVEAQYDSNARFVRLKLKNFSAGLLSDLAALKFLPKKLIRQDNQSFVQHPVGTGAFTLVAQSPSEIVLEAIPSAGLKYKNLIFRVIADENTRYLKMLKGEIDIAQNEIPTQKVFYIENRRKDLNVFKAPGLSMSYLLFNLEDPLLAKKPVREAIAHAIRRDEIIKYKLDSLATPATSILSTRNPFHNPKLKNQDFDLNRSRELLKNAGLNSLSLTLKTSNAQVAVENGKVLTNQLGAAGINVRHQSFEWGTFFSDVNKGNFQIATLRWVGIFDPDIYRIALHSAEIPPGKNRGRYKNLELDKLLDQGLRIADENQRREHYLKIQEIVHNDIPFVPLWYDMDIAVVNPRIQGYVQSPTADYSFVYYLSKVAQQ